MGKLSKLIAFMALILSCQNVKKTTEVGLSTEQKTNSLGVKNITSQKNSKVLTELVLSRHGPPLNLNLEFLFKGFPLCDKYEYHVQVFKKNNKNPLYQETKIIKLKEIKCHPCLPSGPVNNCGNTCELITLRPFISILNFDLTPYIKEKAELLVKVSRFKGLSQLKPVITPEIPIINEDPKTSVGIQACENELSDAELDLKFPDAFINR